MGSLFSATTEGAEALAAATAETLVQLRGLTTVRPQILAYSISFDGVTAGNTPVLVRLAWQTTDGTGAAATETVFDGSSEAALTTAFNSFSAEPTLGTIIEEFYVHPNGGLWLREFLPDRGPKLAAATTSRIGIIATAAQIVNATAFIQWQE